MRDLIQKIYCHHDPELDKLLPEQFPARAVIQTIDGRRLEKTYEIPHGDGKNPLSLDELRGKYEPLASSIYSQKRVREIEKQIMSLETLSDFSAVTELLSNKGG